MLIHMNYNSNDEVDATGRVDNVDHDENGSWVIMMKIHERHDGLWSDYDEKVM